jgi:hypothetical protein
MKLTGRFWILVLLLCATVGVNLWGINGVSGLQCVLVAIVGSVFFVTVYIASRATSLRPFRMVINASAGLTCGCLCAGMLGRETGEVIVFGLVGVLLGVTSDVWLSRILSLALTRPHHHARYYSNQLRRLIGRMLLRFQRAPTFMSM